MKTPFGIWNTVALLLVNVGLLHGAPGNVGQQPPGQTVNVPPPTPYAVTVQDGNSRVWERTVYELAPDGTVVPKKHHYTELATGLNYRQNGQWVPSKEEIDIQPDGTASATQGQHQAYFPGDIYQGQIKLVTPDGLQLYSRPVGLSYDDGNNTVMIAVLTNSVGQVLGTNQVIYTNAFTGINADLLYTYTKAGFEQDIVLREQPPTPESFGLDSQNTRLQVLTEFFNTADPVQTALPASPQDRLSDTTLAFGQMKMVRGKAFSFGNASQIHSRFGGIPVYKSWLHLDGRTFLMEELPVQRIEAKLEQLPVPANAVVTANSAQSVLHKVSATRLLPPVRLVQNSTNTMHVAKVELNRKSGLVLDYVTFDYTSGDVVFQGDTTYLVYDGFTIFGTTTIEGGAVIKFEDSADETYLEVSGPLVCNTAAYRPAVLTSVDDNSVGESIGSGSPVTQTNSFYIYADGSESSYAVSNLRFSYAFFGLGTDSTTPVDVRDCQFINCWDGIFNGTYAWGLGGIPIIDLHNVLFGNCNFAMGFQEENMGFVGENVTVVATTLWDTNSSYPLSGFFPYAPGALDFTNSIILANVPGGPSVNTNCVAINPAGTVFQTVGGGNFYLTNGSPYRNYGTTNISPALLAELSQKTTYPPIIYTNATFSVATTFSPQAQRDTDTPDLGYHYDPLDYVFGGCTTSSNLTFTAGTAVGWFRTSSGWQYAGYGLYLQEYVVAAFNGTATSPCYWVRLNTVQEQDNSGGYGPGGMDGEYDPGSNDTSTSPVAQLDFTRCSMLDGGNHFRDDYGYIIVNANNSEFYGGNIAGYIILLNFTNCFMDRCGVGAQGDDVGARYLAMRNCSMHGGYIYISHWSDATWPVWIENSAFDGTDLSSVDTNSLACDYNAFLTNNTRLPVFGTHDLTNIISFNWQSSWFGNYYLPSDSPLIDKGNTNANYLGLYHFTTQTNQVPETNSIVDIGYHYVVVDTNGIPLDSNGDGIPDYIEDANGNGLIDSGEIGWNIPGDLGLKVIITRPRNGIIVP